MWCCSDEGESESDDEEFDDDSDEADDDDDDSAPAKAKKPDLKSKMVRARESSSLPSARRCPPRAAAWHRPGPKYSRT